MIISNKIYCTNNIVVTSVNAFCNATSQNKINTEKILVVSKLSRYEFERHRHRNLTEKQLEEEVRNRGTDYEKLIHYYKLHKNFEHNIVHTMQNMGIEVQVVNRLNYMEDKIQWADIIMPAGGDGTFLLAASKIRDNKKPVIGLNSDPNRSEGHLCLPKRYSSDIKDAINRLQMGNFEWKLRSRIRTTLLTQKDSLVQNDLYMYDGSESQIQTIDNAPMKEECKMLPVLALNEVFMGECLSARVSHLEMKLNSEEQATNMKCSGLCVCTGTGSTSWHLSINRLPVQSVAELLRLLDIDATEGKDSLATVLADMYNKNLIFGPEDKRLGYTIRDLISAGVWPQPKGIKSRGFASKIQVKSKCVDAYLVIDGGVSFPFNDGCVATLEVNPRDALRTVVFSD